MKIYFTCRSQDYKSRRWKRLFLNSRKTLCWILITCLKSLQSKEAQFLLSAVLATPVENFSPATWRWSWFPCLIERCGKSRYELHWLFQWSYLHVFFTVSLELWCLLLNPATSMFSKPRTLARLDSMDLLGELSFY